MKAAEVTVSGLMPLLPEPRPIAAESRELASASAKASGGVAKGAIWWMEREITEKKKYLPASRR